MSAIFISHSSKDNRVAEEIRDWLADLGHRSVFLDFDPAFGIPAGRDWERELYHNIRACRAVIVLCSRHSMASRWCFMEITHARALGKHLFPVKIDDCDLEGVLTDRQVIDLTAERGEALERLENGILASGLDPADAFDWDGSRPAYPGLLAFQEKDAAIFFGRDDEIGEGLDLVNKVRRLGQTRLVMVLGASGTGKSSLVRAGLLPRLRRDTERWLVVDPFRPRDDPALALATVLSRAFDRAGKTVPWNRISERIRAAMAILPTSDEEPPTPDDGDEDQDGTALVLAKMKELEAALPEEPDARTARYLRLLRDSVTRPDGGRGNARLTAARRDGGDDVLTALADDLRRTSGREEARVLLVVDQFEELLGHSAEHGHSRFLRLLRASLDRPASPLLALGTMRSDFLGPFQKSPALLDLRNENLSLGPMSPEDVVQVIEKPAELAAIDLEPGLVQALVDDAETEDALPLLAFTLRELNERYGGDHLLEIHEYRSRLGGLHGAVAKVAEEILAAERVSPKEETNLRAAFLALVRVTEDGTYARTTARWDDLPEASHPLLEKFVQGRLLVAGSDEQGRTLEVAHESLFRSWGRLVSWLEESAEALRLRREIQLASRSWVEAERAGEELWRGGRLARARELIESGDLPLEPAGHEFVEASHGAEQAQIQVEETRRKRIFRGVLAGAAVAVVLAVVAVAFALRASRAEDEAEQRKLETALEAMTATRNAVALEDRLASLNRARYKSLRRQLEDRLDLLAGDEFEAWWSSAEWRAAPPSPDPRWSPGRRIRGEAASLARSFDDRLGDERLFALVELDAAACPEGQRYLENERLRIVGQRLTRYLLAAEEIPADLSPLQISLDQPVRALCPIATKYLAQARRHDERAAELRSRLGVLRADAGLPPEGSDLLLTVDLLRVKHGSGLVLLFGEPASPRVMLFDGGTRTTYKSTLRPRLEELRQLWWQGRPLPLDLVVSTQSDGDAVFGLISLLEDLSDPSSEDAPDVEVAGLWSNSFPADDLRLMAQATPFWSKLRLQRSALELNIPFNQPFGRFVTLPAAGAVRLSWPVHDGEGVPAREEAPVLGITVLGPPLEWLREYFDDYVVKEIRRGIGRGEGAEPAPELQAALDGGFEVVESFASDRLELPPSSQLKALDAPADEGEDHSMVNLASMVLMLELGGKRIFLTADARADTLLAAASQAGYTDETGAMEVDALLLPHHGSDRNVSVEFFRRVRARQYLVQGNGRFGNPEVATFAMLFEGRRGDPRPFSIHMNFAPEEMQRTGSRPYPTDELCALLRREREAGTPFRIVTPSEGALSLAVDLIAESPLDRGVIDQSCGLADRVPGGGA